MSLSLSHVLSLDPLRRLLTLGVLASLAATLLTAAVWVVVTGQVPSSQPVGTLNPLGSSAVAIPLSIILVGTCWALVKDRPLSATGLSLVAVAWQLPQLAAWPLLDAHLRAWLLAAAPLSGPGVALMTRGWGPAPNPVRAPLLAAWGLAVTAAGVHLLGYDPFFEPGCAKTCEAAPTFLSDTVNNRVTLALCASLTVAACVAAVLACLRTPGSWLFSRLPGVVGATLFGAAAVVPSWRWGHTGTSPVEDALTTFGVSVVVLTALIAAVRTRLVRRNVRNLVQHLTGTGLAKGLLSPVTSVHFRMPDDGRWIDAAGRVVDTEPELCSILSDPDGPSVRLGLSRLAEPTQVLSSTTPASRLALENVRLLAVAKVRVVDVQASQRRIVEASDRERRRIERDLHDGAQQRLVAVIMHLRAQGNDCTIPPDSFEPVELALRAALANLRGLSDDYLPAVLEAEGLEAAIEDLVAAIPLQVDVRLTPAEQPLAPAVQTAVYLAVAAALQNVIAHTDTKRATIELRWNAEVVTLTVSDNGQGGAIVDPSLTHVADRIGALGGVLEIDTTHSGGTSVKVCVPCG